MAERQRLTREGFSIKVIVPKHPENKRPILLMDLGDPGPYWSPEAKRTTAKSLRLLAEDLDAAWAELDQRNSQNPLAEAGSDHGDE